MKRSFIIFALLCTVLIQATAQNPYKNEIAVAYAPLSNYDVLGHLLLLIDKAISDKIAVQVPGAFGIEYFRRLGDLVSVGGISGIYYFSSHPEGKDFFSCTYYTLMAGAKLHWYQRETIMSARTSSSIYISAFRLRFWVWKSARDYAGSQKPASATRA